MRNDDIDVWLGLDVGKQIGQNWLFLFKLSM